MLRLPCPRAAASPLRAHLDDPGSGPLVGVEPVAPFAAIEVSPEGVRPSPAVAAELERCDAYVVVVADPVTGAVDSYGPYAAARADHEVARRRDELDAEGLTDVSVQRVRHHRPE